MRPQSLLLTLLTVVRGVRVATPRPGTRPATEPSAADPAAQLARLATCWAARHGRTRR
ncbi:MAG: hypothetical protein H0W06_01125 [Chloroflexia bacterium]|nr:hypothetical protein [Chloroflexia bacterium]